MGSILKPYNGENDYIFVSYSSKDSDKVFEILKKIQSEGFNFWYDTKIEKVDEIPEYLIDRIGNCKVAIAFHSSNSKNSTRCKDEIAFAASIDKDFISIYLEDVELSTGVQMALNRFPSINFYDYAGIDDKKFYSELLKNVGAAIFHLPPFTLEYRPITGGRIGVPIAGGMIGSLLSRILGGIVVLDGEDSAGGDGVTSSRKQSEKSTWEKIKEKFFKIFSKSPAPSAEDTEDDLTPYEGKKPYAFISYSHKDIEKVFPILRKFKSAGLRFWYDKGITHGSEWADCIAEHILDCECLIAFHSNNSNCSSCCKDEIFFLNHDGTEKKILSIYLENVTLAVGTQLRISRFQAINLYDYPNKKNFYSEMMKSKAIQSCLA